MSVPHPCLFCVCVQACKQEAEKERGHERQTETVWGWFWLGSIGAFTLCFVGKSSTGVTNNPPPFSPHQQKCIHLDTNTHMRSQTGSFTESSLAPTLSGFSFYSVRKLELSAVLCVSLVPVEECYDPDIPNGCSPKKKLDFLFSVMSYFPKLFSFLKIPIHLSSMFYCSFKCMFWLYYFYLSLTMFLLG